MSIEPYSQQVRQLFANPWHAGSLEPAVTAAVDDHGMRITLFAEEAAGAVSQLRFQAWGCPHFIAAAEAICSAYEGRPVTDLEQFTAEELMQSLPVPVEKTGRILVIEDAVRALVTSLRRTSTSRRQMT